MKEIGGLSDALKHWRSKKGGTVRANATLIKEIKGGLSDAFKDLQNIIKNKKKDATKNGTNHINVLLVQEEQDGALLWEVFLLI